MGSSELRKLVMVFEAHIFQSEPKVRKRFRKVSAAHSFVRMLSIWWLVSWQIV